MPSALFPQADPSRIPAASPEMTARVEAFDWSATAMGPIEAWPRALAAAARLMLASPVPMVMLMGRQGIMVYNDAYSVFAGKRHPRLLGSPVLEGWREVADFNARVMEAGLRGETLSFQSQELTLHRNGAPEQVWMDLDYSPLLGESGEPEGVLAIVIETTARIKAEKALTRSEERLAIALDAAGMVGTWEWDLASGRVTGDARFAAMYGVTAAEAVRGLALGDYEEAVHPDDRRMVRDKLAEALASRRPFRAEYRLKRGAAPSRWVLAAGRVDTGPSGAPARMSGVSIDISERKAQEALLATSEAKFRVLADTMPQMVWSALPDGFHDYHNARWHEFTGTVPGSTDGEGWSGAFHPEDRQRARERWRHSVATGEPYEVECRLRHRSGAYRWTLGRALPVADGKGRITRWFGTCTDVHDSRIAAEEREVVAQELSHRIKNIFSVLNGIIALSARSFPGAKPFADQLKKRIFAMGQAHDFVRPHSAASKPAEEQTSLKALAAKLLSPFAGTDGETIRFEGEDAVIDEAAATPLALLFHELATNAAKYGALATAGGSVTLSGRNEGETYILQWKERGGALVAGAPAQEGFGSRLMGLSVEGQLSGSVKRLWEPDGLCLHVTVPREALRRQAKLHGTPAASPAAASGQRRSA